VARVLDAHVFLGDSIQGFGQQPDGVLAELDRLGIEAAVLVPVRPRGYAYGPENERVADARRRHPDRFLGLGRVDPRQPDAATEAERCLAELGLRGVFVHPWEDAIAISDARLDPILEVCAARSAPLMVAAGYPWVSEATQVAELARRHPSVPIVMTNGGQINISGLGQRNAWLAMEGHPNVHITTSGVYREDFIEEVAAGLGAGRVMFGSQSPLFDMDMELHRLLWAHVDDGPRATMLWDTAARVFGTPGDSARWPRTEGVERR
jgi:predicted TIM-barrel fold metal-dependent hydrolase